MAESLNFSVGIVGLSSSPRRLGKNSDEITLDDALIAVSRLPISDSDKEFLSEMAKKIPNGSLGNFLSNYSNHLKKC